MANGRPTGDGSDRSPDKGRGKNANQQGLAALGREMRSGSEGPSVANESGLRALGASIDSQGGRSKSRSKARRSGKPKWSTAKKTVVALCALIVLVAAAVGGGYAYLWYRYNQINKVHINAEVAAASGAPFTILVIGSDSRVGESSQAFGSASVVTGQRSDVVQLWRVTPATKQIQILSIPRDTVVSMLPPDTTQYGTYNRINSSFNSGADQLVKTITANFGIPINHVVQVDFAGFQDAVNALGGISMDFPYPVRDRDCSTGVCYNNSGLDIPTAGCQVLNGQQALALSRSRYYQYDDDGQWISDPSSDIGRIQRQNLLIDAALNKAKSTYNPLRLNTLLTSVVHDFSKDNGLSANDLFSLSERYKAFSGSDLQAYTLPTVGATSSEAGAVEVIQPDEAGAMITQFLGGTVGPITSPPLDAYGEPLTMPVGPTATTAPPSTAPSTATGSATPAPAPPAVPSYDPVPC